MHCVHADTFDDWRRHARALLHQRITPDAVQWANAEQPSLFNVPTNEPVDTSNGAIGDDTQPEISVPKRFMSMAKQAACFIDHNQPTRKWALLYSLLWRIVFEHRHSLAVQSDPEVQAVQRMAKAVSRDMHKMKAFVRFQNIGSDTDTDDELYTAWFEPDHAIIENTAPFFAKRFTGMSWSILTPHGCAHWDRQQLKISPGIARPDLPQDHFETFWKAYYCAIFNPARLKENTMQAEMPKKYWRYLPEAQCIRSLTTASSREMQAMIDRDATDSDRLSKKSSQLRSAQKKLRATNRT